MKKMAEAMAGNKMVGAGELTAFGAENEATLV